MKLKPFIFVLMVMVLLPFLGATDYYLNLISQILITAIFAQTLNLLLGFGGLVNLGHAAFSGSAAYAVALLISKAGLPHLPAALGAITFTCVMAGVFGFLALRASGISFLMITLALGQILWGLALRWAGLTGGENGLSGYVRPQPFGFDITSATSFYYCACVVTAIAFIAIAVFVHSSFGASLLGTKHQPRRMKTLGYNVWLIQWLSFIYAGFWAGVSGLLFFYYHKFVSPQVLSLSDSAEAVLMVIAGGVGTLTGPIIGAAIVVTTKNVVSGYFKHWPLLLGIVFVLIVLFMPDGLVPGVQRLAAKLRSVFGKRPSLPKKEKA